MCSTRHIETKIKKLKSELLELAKKTKDISAKEMVNKSQKLDKLIVRFHKKKNKVNCL